jgi:predicted PurR-regulated permease PerM
MRMTTSQPTSDAATCGENARATESTPPSANEAPVITLSRRERTSIALNGLFVLALLFALYFAATLLIPLVVAVLLSMLLAPVVNVLGRVGLPTPAGAALVVLSLLTLFVATAVGLSGAAQSWINRVPQDFHRIEEKLQLLRKPLDSLKAATRKIEQATEADAARPMEVKVERPGIVEQLLTGTPRILASVGMVVLLLFLLLASGDAFLRKVVEITPTLADKKRAVEITRSIQSDIGLYLGTLTLLNCMMGLAIAAICWTVGLPDPPLWGAVVLLLSFAPYVGSAVITGVLALAGLLTFTQWSTALIPAAVYLAMMFTVANLIVPFVVGRRLTLSPIAIFVAIIFWGWMWGVIGALVAVPLLASFKIICERIDPLAPVAEFLTP